MASDFLAGCIGGCAGVLVGHPFDTVKVRLQTQPTLNPMYKGTLDCFMQIIKKESVLGLYKGMASPLYSLAFINAIVFGVQRNLQRRMNDPDTLMSHFTSGALAGLAQTVVCSPMELAKTRMQVQGQGESRTFAHHKSHVYKSSVDCIIQIFRTEGTRGVFKGFSLTAVREAPSFGVYFLSFEFLLRSFESSDPEIGVSTPALLMAGGLAGMASWLCTYPIDVVKSRIQADMKNEYKNAWDCVVKSYHEAGPRVFTKGLCSTLLRAFPVNAATFGAVTWVLNTCGNHRQQTAEC